jgi:hypothetical protein
MSVLCATDTGPGRFPSISATAHAVWAQETKRLWQMSQREMPIGLILSSLMALGMAVSISVAGLLSILGQEGPPNRSDRYSSYWGLATNATSNMFSMGTLPRFSTTRGRKSFLNAIFSSGVAVPVFIFVLSAKKSP